MRTAVPTSWKKTTRSLIAGLLCSLLATPVLAITIEYQVEDLTDAGGGDLWQYSYRVSDHTFQKDDSFLVLFDYQTYGDIEQFPPSVNSDWDPLTFDPDLGLPSPIDGSYDALALVDNASLANLFVVDFIWLGAGVSGTKPGAQPFEVYEDGNFIPIASGTTVATPLVGVPVPATVLLFAFGLGALTAVRKKTNMC